MAVDYTLGFNPIWYISDIVGRPLGGGSMYASSSLNPTQQKFIFMDAGGQQVWPNPVLFNENGQQGPFYFEFDSDNPEDLYFLQVFDAQGNLVWTMDEYSPDTSGGGGSVTTTLNIQNQIINNVFYRHVADIPAIASSSFRIAPGAHSGLAQTASLAGPDIWFYKGNNSATDSLTFPAFTLGTSNLTNDSQPVDYLLYTCTAAGSSESFKYIQIPVTEGVQNLANNTVTFTLWVKSFASASTLQAQWMQFFGDGSPTPKQTTPFSTIAVTTSWTKVVVTTTIPSINLAPPAILGACGNSGLFLQLQFPIDETCSIGLTKPWFSLGTVSQPAADFQTYDVIDSTISSPRTGHLVAGFDTTAPLGYLRMNDTTIGSASSGATTADPNTFPLYNLIWNGTAGSPTFAPIFTSGGVATTRGATAVADFVANKRLQLLYGLGAVIGNAGQANVGVYGSNTYGTFALGQPFGNELNTISVSQMPVHNHPGSFTNIILGNTVGAGAGVVVGNTISVGSYATTVAAQGSGGAHNTVQPTLRFNYFIKL